MQRRSFLLATVLGCIAAPLCAADATLPAEHHPWGRFPVGSWKTVRVVSEAFDANGQPKSVSTTETKTTLVSADANSYTLKIEVSVDVQGKRFLSQAQTIRTGYCGEAAGQTLESNSIGKVQLEIGDRQIPCDLRRLVIVDSDTKRVTTVHYSNQEPPYVLKRESTLTRLQDGTTSTTSTEVVALGEVYKVLGEEHRATRFLTLSTSASQNKTVTKEVQCADVPGGVVAHESVEMDTNGKELRRSKLSLVDYGLGKVSSEDAWKGRKRIWQRNRRSDMRNESDKRSK